MKMSWRIPLLALMLVSAVALARAADEKAPAEKTEKAKSEAKGGDVASKLEATEHQAWEAFKNKDSNAFMSVMDKDGWMVDASGFTPASGTADMMKDYEVRSYTIENTKAIPVSKDVYLFTYTAHGDASYKGQQMPNAPMYCTTVYAKRGGKWVGLFHQESMGIPPAAPSAGSSGN